MNEKIKNCTKHVGASFAGIPVRHDTTVPLKKSKGITLIALVITIVILLILAGVTINNFINTGVVEKADSATEETRKQIASEIMNLKITNIQMSSYVDTKKLPTLQYLADNLCTDSDIEYVLTTSKALASLNKIDTTGCSSIFTKLREYPYEFEINSSMQLASIDGVKIADTSKSENENSDETVTITKEQFEQLLNRSAPTLDYENAVDISSYITENNKYTIPKNGFIVVSFWANSSDTRWASVNLSGFRAINLVDTNWGVNENFSTMVNKDQTVYFTLSHASGISLIATYIPYK